MNCCLITWRWPTRCWSISDDNTNDERQEDIQFVCGGICNPDRVCELRHQQQNHFSRIEIAVATAHQKHLPAS